MISPVAGSSLHHSVLKEGKDIYEERIVKPLRGSRGQASYLATSTAQVPLIGDDPLTTGPYVRQAVCL